MVWSALSFSALVPHFSFDMGIRKDMIGTLERASRLGLPQVGRSISHTNSFGDEIKLEGFWESSVLYDVSCACAETPDVHEFVEVWLPQYGHRISAASAYVG